jgi:hypothetical protein
LRMNFISEGKGYKKSANKKLCHRRVQVPKVGFEPTRAFAHYALNVARLPIPPLRLSGQFYQTCLFCQP